MYTLLVRVQYSFVMISIYIQSVAKSGSGGNHDMARFQFSYRTEYNVKLTFQEVKYLTVGSP
jgi:hypothetical protein